jgi:IS6 family transposase
LWRAVDQRGQLIDLRLTVRRNANASRGFRSLSAAKNTLKGIETFRAIKKGHLQDNQIGVINEISFVANLFDEAA